MIVVVVLLVDQVTCFHVVEILSCSVCAVVVVAVVAPDVVVLLGRLEAHWALRFDE